jgi:hypothetical protein
MRLVGLAVMAALLSACTTVRMVQRDGCWIKQTEKKPFKRVREEIGPCMKAQPKWASDQLTRLVQECVAQADHRWQVKALEAWSKGKPFPAQAPQDEILRTCMQEARVGMVTENEELKRRVAELSNDRTALRADADEERAHLRSSHEKMAEWLGQAAQKPPGNATATASATSDGRATNDTGATLSSGSNSGSGATAPAATPVVVPASPAPPAPASAAPAPAKPPDADAAPLRSASAKPVAATTPKRAARAASNERGCEVPLVLHE